MSYGPLLTDAHELPICSGCKDSGLFSTEIGLIACSCPAGKPYRDNETLTRLKREFNIAMTYGDFHVANDLKDQIEKLKNERTLQ